MAASHPSISAITAAIPSSSNFSSRSSLSSFTPTLSLSPSHAHWKASAARCLCRRHACRAMVQQTVQGAPAAYAKEMERLSAKESLLLAQEQSVLRQGGGTCRGTSTLKSGCAQFKDAGGFEAFVSGKTTDMQRIDVNERITGLERLNPTPRPTTSPFLEGQWNFEWFGSGSPGLLATRFIFENFPSSLANLSKMDVFIKDGNAKITANMRLLNAIESKVILSTKLSVEGPLRMKEEYVEGVLVSPTVIEERVPEQLKGALGQAANALQQLPVPIRDAVASGLKVPLSGSFQRLFMISYLDEEILIIRNTAGMPEVLTRLDASPSFLGESIPEYES